MMSDVFFGTDCDGKQSITFFGWEEVIQENKSNIIICRILILFLSFCCLRVNHDPTWHNGVRLYSSAIEEALWYCLPNASWCGFSFGVGVDVGVDVGVGVGVDDARRGLRYGERDLDCRWQLLWKWFGRHPSDQLDWQSPFPLCIVPCAPAVSFVFGHKAFSSLSLQRDLKGEQQQIKNKSLWLICKWLHNEAVLKSHFRQ